MEIFEEVDQLKAEGIRLKDLGNECFKRNNFSAAIENYQLAIQLLKDSTKAEVVVVFITCNLNAAQACICLSLYDDAIVYTTRVIDNDKTCVKALYRRGMSFLAKSQLDLALLDFRLGHTYEPSNNSILEQIDNALEKILVNRIREMEDDVGIRQTAQIEDEPTQEVIQHFTQDTTHFKNTTISYFYFVLMYLYVYFYVIVVV